MFYDSYEELPDELKPLMDQYNKAVSEDNDNDRYVGNSRHFATQNPTKRKLKILIDSKPLFCEDVHRQWETNKPTEECKMKIGSKVRIANEMVETLGQPKMSVNELTAKLELCDGGTKRRIIPQIADKVFCVRAEDSEFEAQQIRSLIERLC